jgi:hypothetical protein
MHEDDMAMHRLSKYLRKTSGSCQAEMYLIRLLAWTYIWLAVMQGFRSHRQTQRLRVVEWLPAGLI